jgi:para-aminobenzoate synthetase component 1
MGLADIAERTAAVAVLVAPWREPLGVAAAFSDEPYALALLSGGAGRWSYVMRRPVGTLTVSPDRPGDPWTWAAAMLEPSGARAPGGPPFQGGLAGLAAYELGVRAEPTVPPERRDGWPDLAAGLYLSLLAFDHVERRVLAVGRGADEAVAHTRAAEALTWLEAPAPDARPGVLAEGFAPLTSAGDYRAAVSAVTDAIAAGEIFQANIARAWGGRLGQGVSPFDVLARLAGSSPAPFAAYLRLPGLALVSNSPERFISSDPNGRVEAQPIKGTRPRGADAAQDAALARDLVASPKDRAENLMIVDLMRNDLSRVCAPGTVKASPLFALESFANVHHLVSTVTGQLAPGKTALDLMRAAFPPGSITGAPKVQAMRVIRRHETPRGPYCGALFWAGFDGAMDSSVLIRTVLFEADAEGWRFEARAGAGIVADSDPAGECAETEAKIAALASALNAPLGGAAP